MTSNETPDAVRAAIAEVTTFTFEELVHINVAVSNGRAHCGIPECEACRTAGSISAKIGQSFKDAAARAGDGVTKADLRTAETVVVSRDDFQFLLSLYEDSVRSGRHGGNWLRRQDTQDRLARLKAALSAARAGDGAT